MNKAIITKRGRYGGTWVHPLLAIDYVLWADSRPELKLMVYEAALKQDPELIQHLMNKSKELGQLDNDKTYLYLIKEDNSNHYKIGVSINPEDRLKSLQTASKTKLNIVAYCVHENAYEVEQSIHAILNDCRKCGEWFELDEEIVIYILREYYGASI